jgi:hypothetical protein
MDVGCWYQVWVPKVLSGRTDHAHSPYIDHRIVGDGNVKFALTDMSDIGKYVAKIIADPRTINRRVLAYTEVLSMNGIWDVMARVTGEEPPKSYVRSTGAKKKCTCRSLTNSYRLGVGGTTARYHCGVSETTPGKLQVPLRPEQHHGYGQLQHGSVPNLLVYPWRQYPGICRLSWVPEFLGIVPRIP